MAYLPSNLNIRQQVDIMYKKFIYIVTWLLFSFNSYALLGVLSGDNESDNSLLHRRMHSQHVSSETKAVAKVAACATVAKGVCLGVSGAKYLKQELNESATKSLGESGIKRESYS